MKDFKLQIMASDHMVFDGLATSISLPTTEGSTGILADHSNLIMATIPGVLEFVPSESYKNGDGMNNGSAEADSGEHQNISALKSDDARGYNKPGVRQEVVISDGLVKVENGEVMVLVDTAERPEDIDENRANRAAEEAREEILRHHSNREYTMINAELSRAMSRIKASRSKHHL